MILFFATHRDAVIQAMADARAGETICGAGVVRPRERKPRRVVYTVSPDPEHEQSLKWVFELAAPETRSSDTTL